MSNSSNLKFRLAASGNVGVGTLFPNHKLHVGSGNLNVTTGNVFMVNNVPVLTSTSLGNTVIFSQLQTLGNLSTLNITGNVSLGNTVVVNSVTNRVGLGLGLSQPNYSLDIAGDIMATTYRQNTSIVWSSTTKQTFDTFQSINYFPENTADTTSMSGLTGNGKWYGGVLAPNGKIYGIPLNSTPRGSLKGFARFSICYIHSLGVILMSFLAWHLFCLFS
jgi:hypothetical protein